MGDHSLYGLVIIETINTNYSFLCGHVKNMPIEIKDKEKFIELSTKATECRVKKNTDNTKLKIRTSKYLYTIKLDPAEAEELLGKLSCPIVEIQ